MARTKLTVTEPLGLDELIPQFAENKASMDSLKKLCDADNARIKDQMASLGADTYTAGGYTATRTVSTRESMNEARLLEILKQHGITEVIKTREYVDMDALEDYLYEAKVSNELAVDLASCKEVQEVIYLRVKKAKAPKKEEE